MRAPQCDEARAVGQIVIQDQVRTLWYSACEDRFFCHFRGNCFAVAWSDVRKWANLQPDGADLEHVAELRQAHLNRYHNRQKRP